jgi:glycerol-3-phosphate dehydrogenase
VGTTDVDQDTSGGSIPIDPQISCAEVEYLLKAVQFAFPNQELILEDVQGTFSGIRPVIDTGKPDPSKESREHVFWSENGLLTVTGGKLTTFRLMAHEALEKVRARLPGNPEFDPQLRVLDEPPEGIFMPSDLSPRARLRLIGRYGANTPKLLEAALPGDLTPVGESYSLWAEIRWAARAEAVEHLDDLLLRRTRLGLLLPEGGLAHLERVRSLIQPELAWGEVRWQQETRHYTNLLKKCYDLPE